MGGSKEKFYPNELMNPRKIWNFLKTVTGGGKISITSTLREEVKTMQASTKIAPIVNLFWNIKIQTIRVAFKVIHFNPLIFLNYLILKPNEVFKNSKNK